MSCLSNDCKCFYIGKAQRYVKTRIQEHIGGVIKLYAKNILATSHRSQTTTPPIPLFTVHRHNPKHDQPSPSTHKRKDQAQTPLKAHRHIINNTTTNTPPTTEGSPPTMTFGLPANTNPTAEAKTATHQRTTKKDNCSALARHLYSHARHLHFCMRADVAL